jgi:hypothetical protein
MPFGLVRKVEKAAAVEHPVEAGCSLFRLIPL